MSEGLPGVDDAIDIALGNASNLSLAFVTWESEASYYIRVNYYMNLICLPVIVVSGVVGNVLSLLVFLCTHLKYQSSSIYLACLNAADTGFLICVFLSVWLKYVGLSVTHTLSGCRIIMYLSFVFAFLSVWTVVCFTVERYIVVFYPLRKHKLCTPRRAKMVTCSVGLLAFCSYLVAPLTSEIATSGMSELGCQPKPMFLSLWHIFQHADSVITVIIPSILILYFNIRIAVRICDFLHRKSSKSQDDSGRDLTNSCTTYAIYNGKITVVIANASGRELSHMSNSITPSGCGQETRTRGGKQIVQMPGRQRHHYQIRTTRSLLIVSSTFLALNLPSHVFKLYYSFAYIRFPSSAFLWQNLLQLLYYTNFAVNVLLYSASSRAFRGASKRLWRRWTHRLRRIYKKVQTNRPPQEPEVEEPPIKLEPRGT